MTISDTSLPIFCPLPFVHLVVNSAGGYSQCCQASQEMYKTTSGRVVINDQFSSKSNPDNLNSNFTNIPYGATLQEVFDSKHIHSVRQQLLASEKPKSCSRCWANEKRSFESARQSAMFQYVLDDQGFNYDINEIIEKPLIRSLDLKFSNKCNLHCLMCNAGNSDMWIPLDRKIVKYLEKTVDVNPLNIGETIFKWKDFVRPGHDDPIYQQPFSLELFEEIKSLVPQLHEIQCSGGEPFITEEFIELLKYIIETGHAGHIKLEITTNGTKFVADVMELLTHFKHTRFLISIDGSGSAYDYIRAPYTYKLLLQRLQFLSEYIESGKISASVEIPVLAMVYNLFSISQLEQDLEDLLRVSQRNWNQFARQVYLQGYASLSKAEGVAALSPVIQITPMLNEDQDRLLIKWLPKKILIEALCDYIQIDNQSRISGKDVPINIDWIRILTSYIQDDVDEHIAATKHRELKNYTLLMDKMLNRDYHDFLDPRIADFLDTIESDL
jgi:pyruvate-formate lyase-activating enzyme